MRLIDCSALRLANGGTDGTPFLDRLLARWEVGGATSLPLAFTALSSPPMVLVTWALALFGHSKSSVVAMLVIPAGWLDVAVLDGVRGSWTFKHPYASQRWLRAVRAAVGDDIARRAVEWLIRRYGDEPDYRVKRSDMALAVQIGLHGAARSRVLGGRRPLACGDIRHRPACRCRATFRHASAGCGMTDVLMRHLGLVHPRTTPAIMRIAAGSTRSRQRT